MTPQLIALCCQPIVPNVMYYFAFMLIDTLIFVMDPHLVQTLDWPFNNLFNIIKNILKFNSNIGRVLQRNVSKRLN